MEYQNIINLLGNIPDQVPRFVTKKWVEIYDESGKTYNVNKEIRFKTPMLRSDLWDYNDAYIVGTGKITVNNPHNNAYDKIFALKNNAPFYSGLTKINGKFIDFSDDLNVVMPLYSYFITLKAIEKHLGVCLTAIKMNQILGIIITTEIEYIIQSKILNLLTIKQVLQIY